SSRVTGVRSIELGVRDLHQSAEFYTKVWALEQVCSEGDGIHFRATGGEHHVLTIRERPKPALLGVHFAANDRSAVDALCAKAKGYGVEVAGGPAPLDPGAGGGYGFRFRTPDGLPMSISSDRVQHPSVVLDRSRPTKISHVVLNSARTDDQVPFFIDVLGFKLSDSTHMMEFLRCSADHHSVAVFRNNGPSLNHVAYELPNIDGLMRGTGRVKPNGFDIEWGIGRHGPGSNVFSYFIEPNGFVAEYTTELDQLDDATHVPQNAEYWQKMMPLPDRWGTAGAPSNRMRAAMSGALYLGEERGGARCEDIIAPKLGGSTHRATVGLRSRRAMRPEAAHPLRRPVRMSADIPFDRSFELRPETVEEVVPGVRRLLANNPGPFTFKGTVSYIVGRGQVAIIDPGPDDPTHVQALLDAVRGETVTHILVTHTHRDHSPAVRPVKAATGAIVLAEGPHRAARELHIGEANRLDASGDMDFRPDRRLADGEVVTGAGWALEAVATPGHTANHMAYALRGTDVLFAGDHVMAWSTSVVAPPDGAMSDYMASLDKLARRPETTYYPGHGGAVRDAPAFVRHFIRHRQG